jgi:hypothetical protein
VRCRRHLRLDLCLGVLLLGAACGVARAAGPERSLGVVETADNARLDNDDATRGMNFFAGQEFVTRDDGELRLRVNTSRVEVGASSRIDFLADSCPTGLRMIAGILRFSEPVNGGVTIATPAGVVRGMDGRAASGLIVVHDANNLEISAYEQDLVLDNDGELHVIPAGQSYRIGVQNAAQDPPASSPTSAPIPAFHPPRRKLVFYAIAGAVAVFVNWEIWDQDSESPYKPKPKN